MPITGDHQITRSRQPTNQGEYIHMKRTLVALVAAATTAAGFAFGLGGGVASAHHAEISTRCDSATGETIVSLNIVYPSGSATFGGESIPLNTPLERRITEPTQLVLDGPGTAYDDTQIIVPIQDCDGPPPTVPDPCSWPAVRTNDEVCVSFNIEVECGSISGSATHSVSNQPSWIYGVWFSTDLPTGPDDGTPGGLSFPEDSGDANVFYWVAGTENDVVRGVPTWDNPGQQSIDTDCEEPPVTDPPVTDPPTTTEPPVTTVPEQPTTTTTLVSGQVVLFDSTCTDEGWAVVNEGTVDLTLFPVDDGDGDLYMIVGAGETVQLVAFHDENTPDEVIDADYVDVYHEDVFVGVADRPDGCRAPQVDPEDPVVQPQPTQPDWMNAELPQTR